MNSPFSKRIDIINELLNSGLISPSDVAALLDQPELPLPSLVGALKERYELPFDASGLLPENGAILVCNANYLGLQSLLACVGSPKCDCGGEKASTTHSHWCSVNG